MSHPHERALLLAALDNGRTAIAIWDPPVVDALLRKRLILVDGPWAYATIAGRTAISLARALAETEVSP